MSDYDLPAPGSAPPRPQGPEELWSHIISPPPRIMDRAEGRNGGIIYASTKQACYGWMIHGGVRANPGQGTEWTGVLYGAMPGASRMQTVYGPFDFNPGFRLWFPWPVAMLAFWDRDAAGAGPASTAVGVSMRSPRELVLGQPLGRLTYRRDRVQVAAGTVEYVGVYSGPQAAPVFPGPPGANPPASAPPVQIPQGAVRYKVGLTSANTQAANVLSVTEVNEAGARLFSSWAMNDGGSRSNSSLTADPWHVVPPGLSAGVLLLAPGTNTAPLDAVVTWEFDTMGGV